jgi:hypothetical protein
MSVNISPRRNTIIVLSISGFTCEKYGKQGKPIIAGSIRDACVTSGFTLVLLRSRISANTSPRHYAIIVLYISGSTGEKHKKKQYIGLFTPCSRNFWFYHQTVEVKDVNGHILTLLYHHCPFHFPFHWRILWFSTFSTCETGNARDNGGVMIWRYVH